MNDDPRIVIAHYLAGEVVPWEKVVAAIRVLGRDHAYVAQLQQRLGLGPLLGESSLCALFNERAAELVEMRREEQLDEFPELIAHLEQCPECAALYWETIAQAFWRGWPAESGKEAFSREMTAPLAVSFSREGVPQPTAAPAPLPLSLLAKAADAHAQAATQTWMWKLTSSGGVDLELRIPAVDREKPAVPVCLRVAPPADTAGISLRLDVLGEGDTVPLFSGPIVAGRENTLSLGDGVWHFVVRMGAPGAAQEWHIRVQIERNNT